MAALLKAAGLARSTFYYQLKALDANDRYAEIKKQIRAVYDDHKGRYGYRRITATIRQAGVNVNHKTVQRLMGQLQLKSLVRPKKYRSYRGEVGRVAPNLLKREFSAHKPNQKWVTDVTEFNVGGQKLYLSPVMDLYNGEIVAWQMDRRPSFELISGMLKKAFTRLGFGPGLAVPDVGLPTAAGSACPDAEHVAQGQLLGQRRNGELLRNVKVRVFPAAPLR
jgi:hypothetical protein